MELDNVLREKLYRALLDAFKKPSALRNMIAFKLNAEILYDLNEDNLGEMAFGLIQWAESRGHVAELVVAARSANEDNPKLKDFAQSYTLYTPATKAGEDFERIVLKNSGFSNVETWRAHLSLCEKAVCRIENGAQPVGTGFLVGPGLVLTNAHVLDEFFPPTPPWPPNSPEPLQKPAPDMYFSFDFKTDADGLQTAPAVRYGLSSTAPWVLDYSDREKLDYAFLKVNIPTASNEVAGNARKWLIPVERKMDKSEAVVIIQHPLAAPLKIALGAYLGSEAAPPRIKYSANTEPGSSGSPVFNGDLELTALHHAGDATANKGIPFSEIKRQLKDRGLANLLGAV